MWRTLSHYWPDDTSEGEHQLLDHGWLDVSLAETTESKTTNTGGWLLYYLLHVAMWVPNEVMGVQVPSTLLFVNSVIHNPLLQAVLPLGISVGKVTANVWVDRYEWWAPSTRREMKGGGLQDVFGSSSVPGRRCYSWAGRISVDYHWHQPPG